MSDSISPKIQGIPRDGRSSSVGYATQVLKSLATNPAPGGPGIPPKWAPGAKDAVGTAYAVSSRVWYTVANGVITEVYYPTIDTPQMRDLQYLVTDGETFFHDERRHMRTEIDCITTAALGFKVTNFDKDRRYSIEKQIIGDPHLSCLLVRTKFNVAPEWQGKLRMYVLCAPHLQIGGLHNNGAVIEKRGRKFLLAYRDDVFMTIAADHPFTKLSCGYVGVNDGWTDLSHNFKMDWEYDAALDGNIALTAEVDLSRGTEFTLGVGFGHTPHNSGSMAFQSLCIPFETSLHNFVDQWDRTSKRFALLQKISEHDSTLFERSVNLLLTHEDKMYPGAMIASLSIPWGEDKGDDDGLGGYHLVWTRDMVQSATALLAVGDTSTPLRALIYLAIAQRDDGGFYQNFWIDGRPYWTGLQLDEVSFPIILAWRLWKSGALEEFDPYVTIQKACNFLMRKGPTTAQDRWEEAGGFSPSTLASNIGGLICAAEFMEARGDKHTADFVRTHADFLESHVEKWTVTSRGSLVPGITRHYIRINPATNAEGSADEDPDTGVLVLANQKPGDQYQYPAKDIVDPGFLELVRVGVRKPNDPLVEQSLKVIDAVLKVETPFGPAWKRYNHDGYGQREDGSSFDGWGVGRPWPLLTLERAMYELACGRDVEPYLATVKKFTTGIGMIPEQVWDKPDLPAAHMFFGRATGSADPLMWAHADYVKLLRSIADGKIFDLIDPVAERYRNDKPRPSIEVWKMSRQVQCIPAGGLLRVMAASPFSLHWSDNEWVTVRDTTSTPTSIGLEYVDIQVAKTQTAPIRFTFYWPQQSEWQGKNFQVDVTP